MPKALGTSAIRLLVKFMTIANEEMFYGNSYSVFYIKKCYIKKINKPKFRAFLKEQFVDFKIFSHKKYLKVILSL